MPSRHVRVNAVSPGVIKTPMHSPETHDFLAGLQPLGRMGETQDVVDAVLYLERRHSSPARSCTSTAALTPAAGEGAMWPDRRLVDLLEIEHPIVLAPMAGFGTVELAAAV